MAGTLINFRIVAVLEMGLSVLDIRIDGVVGWYFDQRNSLFLDACAGNCVYL